MGMDHTQAYEQLHAIIDRPAKEINRDNDHSKKVQSILLNHWLNALSSGEYIGYDYPTNGVMFFYGTSSSGKFSSIGVFLDLLTKLVPEFYHWKTSPIGNLLFSDDVEEEEIFKEWFRNLNVYSELYDLQFIDDPKYSASILHIKELLK